MLVLSRRAEERILIGDSVEIVICKVEGGKVRIGIEAPGQKVMRKEVADRIAKQEGGAS